MRALPLLVTCHMHTRVHCTGSRDIPLFFAQQLFYVKAYISVHHPSPTAVLGFRAILQTCGTRNTCLCCTLANRKLVSLCFLIGTGELTSVSLTTISGALALLYTFLRI